MTVQPNIVREYYIGNTRIRFADDFCSGQPSRNVMPERTARRVQRSLSVIMQNGKTETEDVAYSHDYYTGSVLNRNAGWSGTGCST